MSSTTIVRRIDDLGRIVIPKQMRESLNIKTGTPLLLTLTPDNKITIEKENAPAFQIESAGDGTLKLLNNEGQVVAQGYNNVLELGKALGLDVEVWR
jgi:transcriptional pleiotropic regulator of transition state genes